MWRSSLIKLRKAAAWITLPAFLFMFIAEGAMSHMNPTGFGPYPISPRPLSFEFWLFIRNLFFLIALVTGLISIPRWQSLLGLTLTLLFAVWIYNQFISY